MAITSSTMNGGPDSWTGTSMPAPHTAGVATLYLQGNPTAPAKVVRDALYSGTTKNVFSSSRTTNRHLLFTAF